MRVLVKARDRWFEAEPDPVLPAARVVIRPSPELTRFEREYARSRRTMSYLEAMEIFEALWEEARALNPDFPTRDWERDVAPDIELARVLNGLPADA